MKIIYLLPRYKHSKKFSKDVLNVLERTDADVITLVPDIELLVNTLEWSKRREENVCFVYTHTGPSTRYGSFQEDILMRKLFQKPVLIIDKERINPEVDLENSPMRRNIEGMGRSYYSKTKEEALDIIEKYKLGKKFYFSTSLRRGHLKDDYESARKAAESIVNKGRERGIELYAYVPTPTMEEKDGYAYLEDREIEWYGKENVEEIRSKILNANERNKYKVRVIDRDLTAIKSSDFLILNIPRLENMYKDKPEESIKRNLNRYDPRYSYELVTGLGLARCYMKCACVTTTLDTYSRLNTHFFNLGSELYNLYPIEVFWYGKRNEEFANQIGEFLQELRVSE